jgi:hypothetical protein
MKKVTFIYCDLNKLASADHYPLTNRVILEKIEQGYGSIQNGMRIWLYAPTFKNKKFDPSVFLGVVKISEDGSATEIDANSADMIFLSDAAQFRDYSVEDVVGSDNYISMRAEHPEWF